MCFCEYLSFFGYDVSFVDVVKFDYRNFCIKFCVLITRLYFFMCTSIVLCYVFNSV